MFFAWESFCHAADQKFNSFKKLPFPRVRHCEPDHIKFQAAILDSKIKQVVDSEDCWTYNGHEEIFGLRNPWQIKTKSS